jgi:hypothetical protein
MMTVLMVWLTPFACTTGRSLALPRPAALEVSSDDD